MPRLHRARIAAVITAVAAVAAAGCGSVRAPGAAQPARQPPEGFCLPGDSAAAARATPCVSVDPQKYQESNHLFQQRNAAPPALVAAAAPLRRSARARLERLTPAQRTAQDAVTAALVAAGLPAGGIYVEKVYAGMTAAGVRVNEVMFGAFTSMNGPAVCIYGSSAAAAVVVNVGGIIMEGGCLPGPGGH